MSSADTKKPLDNAYVKQNAKHVPNKQMKRRFYSARNLSQQTEPSLKHLDLESGENQVQEGVLDLSPPVSAIFPPDKASQNAPAAYSPIPNSKIKSERTLGGIELMYFASSTKGADTICLMTKVETTYPVTEVATRKALASLMMRHPLLRMTINCDISSDNADMSLCFVQNKEMECDFVVSERQDWLQYLLEEVEQPFDNQSKPLWRCRLLNSSRMVPGQKCDCNASLRSSKCTLNQTQLCNNNNRTNELQTDDKFVYQATVLFIMHHSVMDGGYSLWIFQEFINFLDAHTLHLDIGSVRELPLLPPMEQCLQFQGHDGTQPFTWPLWTDNYLQFCHELFPTRQIIDDYNIRFRDEIATLSCNKPSNKFLVFKLCKDDARAFVNACKMRGSTPNGAVLAASLLAITDLIYPPGYSDGNFEIPFEFMMDLRRHCKFDNRDDYLPHYPGVASVSIPMTAHIKLPKRPVSMETFWKMSASFTNSIQNDISSPDTFEWIQKEAERYVKHTHIEEPSGKSEFVLCVSNMGKLDGVLSDDVSERVRLVDLHGTSSVLIDQMPIFFVTTFGLNGHSYANVSFCEGYTSMQTASQFVGHLQKYLFNYSKL